jgi:hypothetical protein
MNDSTMIDRIPCGHCGRMMDVEREVGAIGTSQGAFYQIPCPYPDCGKLNHRSLPGEFIYASRTDRSRPQ